MAQPMTLEQKLSTSLDDIIKHTKKENSLPAGGKPRDGKGARPGFKKTIKGGNGMVVKKTGTGVPKAAMRGRNKGKGGRPLNPNDQSAVQRRTGAPKSPSRGGKKVNRSAGGGIQKKQQQGGKQQVQNRPANNNQNRQSGGGVRGGRGGRGRGGRGGSRPQQQQQQGGRPQQQQGGRPQQQQGNRPQGQQGNRNNQQKRQNDEAFRNFNSKKRRGGGQQQGGGSRPKTLNERFGGH